jgi:hypothetical protein
VVSSAYTCPMAFRRPWVVEIKKCLVATACSKARVFLRHAHALPWCLQDDVITTCKSCGQVLQHHATVHRRVARPDRTLQMIPPSWLLTVCGLDILGPFPRVVRGFWCLYIIINKFTK